jgi:hypothetical protein
MWQATLHPASGGAGSGVCINGHHPRLASELGPEPGPSTSHTHGKPGSIPQIWQANSVLAGSDPDAELFSDLGLGSELASHAHARAHACACSHDVDAEGANVEDKEWQWNHISSGKLQFHEIADNNVSPISATMNISMLKLSTELFDEVSSRKDFPYHDHNHDHDHNKDTL